MQVKNIPDEWILEAMANQQRPWGTTMLSDLEAALPMVPYRLLLAKLRNMLARKVIDGCACGCRGEFKLHTPRSTGQAVPDPPFEAPPEGMFPSATVAPAGIYSSGMVWTRIDTTVSGRA